MMRKILAFFLVAGLAACGPADVAQDGPSVEPIAQDRPAQNPQAEAVDLSAYDRDLARFVDLKVGMDGFEAEDVVRLYVTSAVRDGGNYDVSSRQVGDKKILFGRALNLRDDSVRSEEIMAVISLGEVRILEDFGMRLQCYRAADPDAWTTDLCP